MHNAVIVGAVRTAVGRKNGKLAGVRPDDLLADTLKALVERVKIDPSEVEDVVMGCVDQVGEQGFNIARNAALDRGVPAGRLRHHARPHVRLRPAGGQLRRDGGHVRPVRVRHRGRRREHEPRARWARTGRDRGTVPLSRGCRPLYNIVPQGLSAEMIAEQWGIKREELDEFSAGSHERAGRAIAEGRFKREIAPITLPDGSVSRSTRACGCR